MSVKAAAESIASRPTRLRSKYGVASLPCLVQQKLFEFKIWLSCMRKWFEKSFGKLWCHIRMPNYRTNESLTREVVLKIY